MAKIFLSVPVLGRPELRMMQKMMQAILSASPHQIRAYYNENDSLISRVRNAHMSVFVNDYPECDYFMTLDSDLEIVNAYPSNNIFVKLLSHDVDFCGGLYALKTPLANNIHPKCSSITMDREFPKFDTGLKEMRWLSSGCWCIKRSVFEKMIEAYPELTYDGDDNMVGKKMYGLCIPMLCDMKEEKSGKMFKKYLSEDWSFCERWKRIGGKMWADTSIALNHIGITNYKLFNVEVQKVQQTQQTQQTQQIAPPKPGYNLGKNEQNK